MAVFAIHSFRYPYCKRLWSQNRISINKVSRGARYRRKLRYFPPSYVWTRSEITHLFHSGTSYPSTISNRSDVGTVVLGSVRFRACTRHTLSRKLAASRLLLAIFPRWLFHSSNRKNEIGRGDKKIISIFRSAVFLVAGMTSRYIWSQLNVEGRNVEYNAFEKSDAATKFMFANYCAREVEERAVRNSFPKCSEL